MVGWPRLNVRPQKFLSPLSASHQVNPKHNMADDGALQGFPKCFRQIHERLGRSEGFHRRLNPLPMPNAKCQMPNAKCQMLMRVLPPSEVTPGLRGPQRRTPGPAPEPLCFPQRPPRRSALGQGTHLRISRGKAALTRGESFQKKKVGSQSVKKTPAFEPRGVPFLPVIGVGGEGRA